MELAGAERRLDSARTELCRRAAAAGTDSRRSGDAALWALDDAAHRRALQAVKVAEGQVEVAASAREAARQSWSAAHQGTEVAMRIAERKRVELRADAERRDRRSADELNCSRFHREPNCSRLAASR